MGSVKTPPPADVRERLERIGQGHVLRFYDRLDAEAQGALLRQISGLELERLPALIDRYVRKKEAFHLPADLSPAPYYPRDPGGGRPWAREWDRAAYRAKGEALLRRGRIAAFTVAGGQGTRLGFDAPKGTYPGTSLTRKPLFCCLAEWIIAARSRYACAIPWYIMTSPINHADTLAFFRQHRFFGLPEADIMFFSQGVLPTFDMATGRLLLAAPGEIATNPDGHGGSLRALFVSGALEDMRRRGVEHLSYVQIDNPLARVVDPVFIGLHASAPDSSGEMSSKMVAKADPAEKVGVFCRSGGAGGKACVVEYSDLPRPLMEERDAGGALRFNAGSIAIHMIGVDFLTGLYSSGGPGNSGGIGLPLHRAEKKVPCIDPETGALVQPAAPNAVKLEAFVFDALPLCRASIVYEADRIDEFAPIKNAEGNDSPATCRAIQTERASRWLERRGVRVPRGADGRPECTIEISPVTAMEAEDLAADRLPARIERGAELAL